MARGQGPRPCCPSGAALSTCPTGRADTMKPTPGETGLSTEMQVSSHHRDRKCTSTRCVSDDTLPNLLATGCTHHFFWPKCTFFPQGTSRTTTTRTEQPWPAWSERWLGAGQGRGRGARRVPRARGAFRGLPSIFIDSRFCTESSLGTRTAANASHCFQDFKFQKQIV